MHTCIMAAGTLAEMDEWPGEFRYCPHCGTRLQDVRLHGRHRRRCPHCEFIHFRNPAVGVAALVEDEAGRVLLIRRGPRATRPGLWAVPAGYVDYGEEVRAAAAREMSEETGLVVVIGEPIFVASNFHDPAKLTVGIWFRAEVVGGVLRAGDDADQAAFFPLDDLPPLAFDTDRRLFDELRRNRASG